MCAAIQLNDAEASPRCAAHVCQDADPSCIHAVDSHRAPRDGTLYDREAVQHSKPEIREDDQYEGYKRSSGYWVMGLPL